jgi:hypothetical protein
VLKRRELHENIARCKSFGFCTYVGGSEVLIRQRLREEVFGSAHSKGVAGARGS